jgi:hypothetical protein
MNGMHRMNPDEHPDVSGKEVKDIVAFGRKCAKGAFPNPTRAGCPDRARLRAMAHRDPSLTLADLPITHVVRCSPCFHDYLSFRRMSLFVRGLQITVASLILATVFVSAVLLVRNRSSDPREPSISQRKEVPSEPSRGNTKPKLAIPVPPLHLEIDLAAFSPTRGDEKEAPRKPILLPQRNLRITFEMPLGMEGGEYRFQLKDSSGAVYSHTRARGHITDGTTSVDVDLDLTGTPRGNATLMIRPPGLSWRSYPSVIE